MRKFRVKANSLGFNKTKSSHLVADSCWLFGLDILHRANLPLSRPPCSKHRSIHISTREILSLCLANERNELNRQKICFVLRFGKMSIISFQTVEGHLAPLWPQSCYHLHRAKLLRSAKQRNRGISLGA